MPLIRIDIIEGRTDEEITALADAVHRVMVNTFAAPPLDRYQIIHEHKPGHMKALDTGLNYSRTNNLVIVQVTQQGRSVVQKIAMYKAMSNELEKIGIRPTDLIISVLENTQADWSFGMGEAQFLTGKL